MAGGGIFLILLIVALIFSAFATAVAAEEKSYEQNGWGLWCNTMYANLGKSNADVYGIEIEPGLIPDWNPFDRWSWIQKYVGIKSA